MKQIRNAISAGATLIAALYLIASPIAIFAQADAAAAPAVLGPPAPSRPATNEIVSATDEVQLSFQGANIDAVVQWLAKTTGKSVVKHPKVQCQLTIVSSKKLAAREALTLVYRALALEGFTTVETSKSIMIVPEGQEPKMSPELLNGSRTELPEGRQKLIKIFSLKHVQATDLRDKVKAVLSDKGTVEIADRANQLIATDYTDNIRLLGELIEELDVPSAGESVIEFFPLKHAEAEEIASLLTLVINAQPAPPASSSSRPSSSSRDRDRDGPFRSSSSGPEPSPSPGSSAPSSGASAQAAGQGVRIWADKVSNRLIVSAPKSKMPEVRRLIEVLDTEKPRDVALRVIQLKHVNAEDLVDDIGPLYQKMSGRSIKDMIEVAANTRANSIIVLSSESNFKAIESLVAELDTAEASEKVIKTFLLRNADAEEVAKQLQDLNQESAGQSRYPFYIFSYSYGSSGRGPAKPTFVADRRRNAVIVQAPPSGLEGIAKMIEALDEPLSDDSLAPKIIRLKYVSATDIEDVLNELFLRRQQTRNYWDGGYNPFGMGSQDSSDRQAGKLYGKVRITSEPYANAIIVTANSRENLAAVEEVVKQLDSPSQAGESTLRVPLKFAKAATVANNINILFARNGSPPLRSSPQQQQQNQNDQRNQQQQGARTESEFAIEQESREEGYFPWLGGQQDNLRTPDGRTLTRPVSDLVGRVRIVPDHRSNSLLISANAHFFTQILKLIEDLDAPTAEVLIEAKIVEVSSDFLDKLGVRWSPDGTATFTQDDLDNSILGRVKTEYSEGFGARNAAIANSLRDGKLDASISVDFLVQFLRRTTEATVLAEPQINIADNEIGKLFVGQQVPFIERSQSTDVGALNQTFSYKDVGIILEVTPHINNEGDVALKIRAESSSIVPGQTLFGGAILDTRNFKTDLTARDGETLILGGIIQKQVSDILRKTPILGSIPGLGWVFKKKDKVRRDVQLIVFLRPKVVRTPEQARQLLEEMDEKAPMIKRWRLDPPPAQPDPRQTPDG
jgi:type II secretion system protein D